MEDWVKDLGEQNVMLVQSVHNLEQAAAGRVKLLENKLQETSNLMSYNMSHSNKSEDVSKHFITDMFLLKIIFSRPKCLYTPYK